MPSIVVENLSKCYRIRPGGAAAYGTLRDDLTDLIAAPLQYLRKSATTAPFWALRDVSFTVEPGTALGIIGRNGAGKSTLLKILSRTTLPTSGHAKLRGRIGSLLEVGTGFHGELSGADNIYLSGAILGMKTAEIRRKFDEIVAFSEVEQFLATPVKRYSSGMYVRLAFAVAAHLEPEILIIDEVLAVGDAAFQQKCLSKLRDAAHTGQTVLFVTHNIQAIAELCSHAVLLRGGQVAHYGPTEEALRYYDSTSQQATDALATVASTAV